MDYNLELFLLCVASCHSNRNIRRTLVLDSHVLILLFIVSCLVISWIWYIGILNAGEVSNCWTWGWTGGPVGKMIVRPHRKDRQMLTIPALVVAGSGEWADR